MTDLTLTITDSQRQALDWAGATFGTDKHTPQDDLTIEWCRFRGDCPIEYAIWERLKVWAMAERLADQLTRERHEQICFMYYFNRIVFKGGNGKIIKAIAPSEFVLEHLATQAA